MKSWPPTPVTNYGIKLLEEGIEPLITYTSPGGEIAFYLNGGLAPFPGVTEGVVLENGISGLSPEFSHLDHKGARQDGVSYADTVYEAAEIDMPIVCTARTPEGLRQVIRDWFSAWNPKGERGRLSWVTPEMGEWWCYPRIFQAPQEPMARTMARSKQQKFNWTIRNEDAFWRSFDSIGEFRMKYRDVADDFSRDDVGDLGDGWVQTYFGPGDAVCETDTSGWISPGRAVMKAGASSDWRQVINRKADFTTATDFQVITLRIGDLFRPGIPDNGYVDIWGRLDDNGSAPTGIRFRIGPQSIKLSRFNAGVETELFYRWLVLPSLWHEEWTFQLGVGDNPRHFRAYRGIVRVMDKKESGTGSALGANYRGAGFGMEAGDGWTGPILPGPVLPPTVLDWSAGDNATITQSGHVTVTNIGSEDEYPDLVVYGPGKFKFADGPGKAPTIEFGPLKEGQSALIKTRPGQRTVVDLTHDEVGEDLPVFQDFLKRLVSFAFNNNIPPLMTWFQSLFGIDPPQGNMYSLLNGRFTRPVPPKPIGSPPVESHIAVEVVDGNASTRIIAALTPRRRWPE